MYTNSITTVVGDRSTGKTIYTKECLMKSSLPKALIIDTFNSPVWRTMGDDKVHPEWLHIKIPVMQKSEIEDWKSGRRLVHSNDPDRLIEWLRTSSLLNADIVFEDASRYIRGTLKKSTRSFLYESKQRNLNLIFFYHELHIVPPELLSQTNYLVLSKTSDDPKDAKKRTKIKDIDKIIEYLSNSDNPYERLTIPIKPCRKT